MCLGRARVCACSRPWLRLCMTNGAGGAALFDIVNVQNWTRRRISGPFKHARFHTGSGAAILLSICRAGLAHRAEHSPRKREAGGSSPPASTIQPQSSSGRAPLWYGGNRRSIRRCGTSHALVAKRQTQPPQKRPPKRHGGSSPPGCTNYRSLRQAAKASVLHTDIPRFESWSEHQTLR